MSPAAGAFEIESEWVHIAYQATAALREVYGYAGRQGTVNLEGIRFRPRGRPSGTLLIYMHPASTLQLLPVPRAMAAAGVDVLCAGSRYARNDTPLIMEMAAVDLGAYVRYAREVWVYRTIVLAGWSGGGSLSVFYQSQAESPAVTRTPAGDPVDLSGLPPADAVIYHAAHLSRAVVLSLLTHRTLADPRFLDATLEPSDRVAGWCFLGKPAEANLSPAGIARYSTLRAWLSQWSVDDAVPPSHVSRVFEASPAAVKDYLIIKGANHYYADQPHHLADVVRQSLDWLRINSLAG
jgi:hypothetical protein